jgi:CelD/BcsL family acetyltransferase involved in cellulose biosynthesis
MAMAATVDSRMADTQTRSHASHIARVQIFDDMQAVEDIWRQLEAPEQLFTPYQRFDFLATWQKHVGVSRNLKPFIVVAYDAERQPLMLLPLALKREGCVRVARFLGGKHATFNMPIWRRDFVTAASTADLDAVWNAIRNHAEPVDIIALTQQPQRWQGLINPMSQLPGQASVNACPLMPITPNAAPSELVSNSFRRRLKGKERKLQVLPGYRYVRATSDADIKRLLDAFFVIKPARMAAQKLPNVFADPGVEDFVRNACTTRLADGSHAIEIHALDSDEETIAIFAGVADDRRFSMMFNTYTMSANARYSPGLILIRDIIDYYAGRGYTSLDLGIGTDDYKQLFCKSSEPIFDSFLALNARGKLAGVGMSALSHAKRLVKQTPALMKAAQVLRGALRR